MKYLLIFFIILTSCNSSRKISLHEIYDSDYALGVGNCSYKFNNGKFFMYDGGCVHDGYGYGKYTIRYNKIILDYDLYFSEDGLDKSKKEKIILKVNDSLNICDLKGLQVSKKDSIKFFHYYSAAEKSAKNRHNHKLRRENKNL